MKACGSNYALMAYNLATTGIRLWLQAIRVYKNTKVQRPRLQRNYIIARDQKSDLHATSSQSSPKINRMLITRPFSTIMKVYNTGPSQFC